MALTEIEMFKEIGHWKPKHKILQPDDLVPHDDPHYKLFEFVYNLIKEECKKNPRRKNGEPTLLHPLNVVVNLRRAEVTDPITLSIGLLHDLVEDQVDFYQKTNKTPLSDLCALRSSEQQFYRELSEKLKRYTTPANITLIVETVKLLTRKKREFYYKSIAAIFSCTNKKMKERAILVKLSDRIHNILSIETFNEKQRLHECFKNIFILNNTKKYLVNTMGEQKLMVYPSITPMARLFKKCCKATYDAYLKICDISSQKGSKSVRSLLQLAFRRFDLTFHGLWEITKLDSREKHPIRLYQGVVRKYDSRLLHHFSVFEEREENQPDYFPKLFSYISF